MGISEKIKDKLTLNTRELLLRVGLQQLMIIVGALMSALSVKILSRYGKQSSMSCTGEFPTGILSAATPANSEPCCF